MFLPGPCLGAVAEWGRRSVFVVCQEQGRPQKAMVCTTREVVNNFHFKAVASDGQLRTGTIHAETERWVAQELRRQGLTPVYVGSEPKKSFDFKLPSFSGARRRD